MYTFMTFFKQILFILMLISPTTLYADYVAKSISNIAGLTNNSVNCILEDSEHFIWIGTWDGLNVYDGRSLRSFRYNKGDSNSISNNVIRQIIEDGAYLWVATDNGINKLEKRTRVITRHYLGNKVPRKESSFVLIKSSNGGIYCLVKGHGVYLYDSHHDKFFSIKNKKLFKFLYN